MECFRDRSTSSRPPRFVTAPVLEAPPASVEYGQPAPRCGVRGARTRGHVHVVEYVTPVLTVCFRGSCGHNDSGANSFPNCNSADRHRHMFAGDVRSASEHVRSGSLCCEFSELSAFFFAPTSPEDRGEKLCEVRGRSSILVSEVSVFDGVVCMRMARRSSARGWPGGSSADGHTGSSTDGHTGSSADGHTGSSTDGHAGSSTDGHAGSSTDGHAGSSTDGHAGSSTDGHAGSSTDGHAGSSTDGHAGSSTDGHAGSSTDGHAGSSTDGHAGSSTDGHAGSSTDGHAGSSTDGHAGSSTDGHAGSSTDGHTGSSTDGHTGSSTDGHGVAVV